MKIFTAGFVVFLCLLFNTGMQAQSNAKPSAGLHQNNVQPFLLKGQVIDSLRQPIAGASIALIKDKTSKVKIIAASSDKEGQFSIATAGGSYLLEITHVGYDIFKKSLTVESDVQLGALVLRIHENVLKEIVVQSKLPEVIRKPDRYVINIEGSLLSAGKNANELFPYLPGVIVDIDGNVSLNGKGIAIMLDDKFVKLSGQQLVGMLNSVRSENIKSIDVIFNPPASFDAEGAGGIIRITTKKPRENGYAGSTGFTYKQGKYPKYNVDAALTYKYKKIVLYGSAGATYNHYYGNIYTTRNNIYSPVGLVINDYNTGSVKGRSYRAGIDYYISKNHFIGFEISGGTTDNKNNIRDSRVTEVYSGSQLDTVIKSSVPQHSNQDNLSMTLNYSWQTDSLGSRLKISTDYLLPSNTTRYSYMDNYYTSLLEFIKYLRSSNSLVQHFNVYSFKIDREMKFRNKKTGLDFGIKFSNARNESDNNFSNYNNITEQWVTDSAQTNDFVYRENIYAAYGSLSTRWGKIGVVSGVRGEYTTMSSNSLKQRITNDYLNIFPNLSVLIPVNKKNTTSLTIRYSKRLTRPDYSVLNPFRYLIDQYAVKKGNPYLKPDIVHSIDATLTLKSKYFLSGGYSRINNKIGEIQYNTDGHTIMTFANLDYQQTFILSGYSSFQLNKKWTSILQLSAYYDQFRATGFSGNSFGVRIYNVNAITVSKTAALQITTQFFPKGTDRFTKRERDYLFVSWVLQQKLAKGKFLLRAGMDDVFNATGYIPVSYTYQGQHNYMEYRTDKRTIYAGITYMFRKGANSVKKEKQRSNDEEQGRVK